MSLSFLCSGSQFELQAIHLSQAYGLGIKNLFTTWNVKDLVWARASFSVGFITTPFAKWGKQSLAVGASSCAVSYSLSESAPSLSVICHMKKLLSLLQLQPAELILLVLERGICAYRPLASHLHIIHPTWKSLEMWSTEQKWKSVLICPPMKRRTRPTKIRGRKE